MTDYLVNRMALQGLILVMDIRHPLTDYDHDLIELCRHAELPLHILLTKADKLKRGPANNTLYKVAAELEKMGVEASLQLFSSHNRSGVDDLHSVLDEWLQYSEQEQ